MLPLISDPESLSTPFSAASGRTDATFELLSHRHRGAVLRVLANSDGTLSVSDLADRMAIDERSREDAAVAIWGDAVLGTRRRLRVSLRHVHLPMLADHGAVEFDPNENTVSLRAVGGALVDRLELKKTDDESIDHTAGSGSETTPT